jgi:anaerobic selenocysteine-containing dehydrogenase
MTPISTPLSRRDWLKLAGAAAFLPPGNGQGAEAPTAMYRPIDYMKAKAIPTICFGCTTQCGVLGWVEAGRVRRISGNPLDPNSRGRICAKANAVIDLTYYPERILHPLRRVGARGEGKWKRITWDEALTEIATRMKKLAAEDRRHELAVHVGRDKTQGLVQRFLHAFGSPQQLNRRAICSSNPRVSNMAHFGEPVDWDTGDYATTRLVLNFGSNPMEAHQGGMGALQRIQTARCDHGARLITFEVRPSATASISDEFYQVKAGTDGAIAIAMAHVIVKNKLHNQAFWERWVNISLAELEAHLEPFTPAFAEAESGVPAVDIERLAIAFAKAAPRCLTLINRGITKHYNGAHAGRAARLLDILVGNIGKPGGFGITTRSAWKGEWGQDGLPACDWPEPKPPAPQPWLPGTKMFETLPPAIQERVKAFPPAWQEKYFGELYTPSEYPLSWQWQVMRVGQLVYPYLKEGRAKLDTYISYTFNPAYNYPEAQLAREVLLDENLIPFHAAIDVVMSETSALADIILPDAMAFERWDPQVTNAYELIPFTGIRQPLHAPLGEARSIATIFRDIARATGGGMEKYFDFEQEEDFYKAWFKNLPIPWEELKRRGIWFDETRQKDYELHERPVPEKELAAATFDPKTGLYSVEKKGKPTVIGIQLADGSVVRGFPTKTRKIEVKQGLFPQGARLAGLPADDPCANPLPTYFRVPSHQAMADNEYHWVTFKWNVHTQSRSNYSKKLVEIIHDNPVWMHPSTAKKLGVKTGDFIEVTVKRPKGNTYRNGEAAPVGTLRHRVLVRRGMHPRVLACSHHCGHEEMGIVGNPDRTLEKPNGSEGMEPGLLPDRDLANGGIHLWWAKKHGGGGHGVSINHTFPIDPTPLVGTQNWYDCVATVKKASSR